MAPKVKGLFKGFKYISQIFVFKEQAMEIGYPTDVRHVAHIGFDCDSTHSPSWMSKFKSASDISPASLNGFDSASLNDFGQSMESWSSQDFKQPRRWMSISSSANSVDSPRPEIPKPLKKKKKKKRKKVTVSSPVMSRSSSRASFSTAFEEPVGPPNCLPFAYAEHATETLNQLQVVISEPLCV